MFSFFTSKKSTPKLPYLLFDIGGTKMRVAVSHDGERFEEPIITHNKEVFEDGMTLFASLSAEALGGKEAHALIGGVAGILNGDRSELFYSPHLRGWEGKPLRANFVHQHKTFVHLQNDAALAALGEAVYGAGRGHRIVAYITVSTGIGGARVVDGVLDAHAIAFEPGHQTLDLNLKEEGEWEALASGTAIKKEFGVSPRDLTDERMRFEVATRIAAGVANTVLHWSPDVVVLGGSILTGKNPIPVHMVEKTLRARLSFLPRLPDVRLAALGDVGGLYGALAQARLLARN